MNDPHAPDSEGSILTIGHSTRSLEELTALLRAHGVMLLADVRTLPRSARHPQFNRDRLSADLALHGIRYVHRPELGGLRKPRPDSVNLGLRNPAFRGFADYMQTAAFAAALDALIELARHDRAAIMCAEADPARCHRSLIADALVLRGIEVEHILSATRRERHVPNLHARGVEGRVVYTGS